MSRIQDILSKAERDGTTRRSTAALYPAAAPPPVSAPRAPVDGSNALDTAVGVRTASPTLDAALVAALSPHSPAAEQYRTIRTRLSHTDERGQLRTLMVTSPGARDGKSVTAANLALTMAQESQRNVVLVDADLRSPAAHALLGLADGPGLTEVLAGTATLDEALVYLPDVHLTVLPAGGAPAFPTELLGSSAMRRTIDTLRSRFDSILLDVPAVTPLADVRTVAPLADGIVMVVRAGATQRPALEHALTAFDDDQVVGIVLNEAH